MESQESQERRLRPVGRALRRALGWALFGSVVLGGVLLILLPSGYGRQAGGQEAAGRETGVTPAPTAAPAPAPGPPARNAPNARTRTAVVAGVPAALPDLAALIREHKARVRDHPQDARSWAVLGTAYVERGRRTAVAADFPKAERALLTSLEVSKTEGTEGTKGRAGLPRRGGGGSRAGGNAEAYDGLAALAVARRDFRSARRWGEEAVRVAPERWTAYPPLIDAYDGLGDHQAARRTLDRLRGLRPGPAAQARTAQAYWDRGRSEDAAAAISDAAARAEGPAERAAYLVWAGELAWQRGELKESLDYCTAALRAAPGEHAALAGRARALAGLGRTKEAVRAYQSVLTKASTPQYALELGELYESLGRRSDARDQYEVLRAAVRGEEAAGVNHALLLGLFEADHGDPEEAVRLVRAEWERQPSLEATDALGWALHRAGEVEEALTFAKRATDRAGGGEVRSALYAYHRGEIERALGLAGPARRHLTEALRLNPYFSPLAAPAAREAVEELGKPGELG